MRQVRVAPPYAFLEFPEGIVVVGIDAARAMLEQPLLLRLFRP
jgi:hypothetical protein